MGILVLYVGSFLLIIVSDNRLVRVYVILISFAFAKVRFCTYFLF